MKIYGGRGAMAAHLDVAQAVDGSNPFDHPKIIKIKKTIFYIYCFLFSAGIF